MPPFNLSGYEALVVDFGTPVPAEAKTFTLVLKDNDPNEDTAGGGGHGIQSTLGWEQNFAQNTLDKPESFRRVTLPMAGFQPFYRGRLVEDAPPLDVGSIKRLQLMCRRCVPCVGCTHSRARSHRTRGTTRSMAGLLARPRTDPRVATLGSSQAPSN